MSVIDTNEKKSVVFADRRKQIEQLYSGNDTELRRIFNKNPAGGARAIYTETFLDTLLNTIGLSTFNMGNAIKISNYAYATDPNFTNLIDYIVNMFMWRYYYFPVKVKEKASESETDYAEIYNLMTEVVDGINIEVTFPAIITKLQLEGAVYMYTSKNTSSKTVSTILLNPAYCKPVTQSQYGTGAFQFDLKYFDDLGFSVTELEEALNYFPKDIVKLYAEYKADGNLRRRTLDARYSTYIVQNDFTFPTKLSVLKSLFDYKKYRANEIERSSTQLDRIITHKIPSYQNQLLFEIPEVKSLHKSMAKGISANTRTKLMTTFGEVQVHPLQPESSVQSQSLEKGHEAILRTAGLNPSLFIGTTKDSLNASLTRDQATIWGVILQLISFYNLTINNLYNFKGYQIELTMLPITHYNLTEMMELYRKNGEYGIGRLESIVASGTKQRDIAHKSKLEEFLKLEEILIPLASSHTQTNEPVVEKTDDKKEIEEDVVEE